MSNDVVRLILTGLLALAVAANAYSAWRLRRTREELSRMIGLIEEACGRKADRRLLEMQPGDVRDTYADISAIQRDLGFSPTTTIDEGVPRFVAWYREYHGL